MYLLFLLFFVYSDNAKEVKHSATSEKEQTASSAGDGRSLSAGPFHKSISYC